MEKIRLYYKSDFKLSITCDVGWQTPFILTFWSHSDRRHTYTASWDGTTFNSCRLNPDNPNILEVGFDDHNLPVGDLMVEIHYQSSDDLMPSGIYDMHIEPRQVITYTSGLEQLVVLDYEGDNSADLMYELPMMRAEQERQRNELQRIAQESDRVAAETDRATSFEKLIFDITAWWTLLKSDFSAWWDDLKSNFSTWWTTLRNDFTSWWDTLKSDYNDWLTTTTTAWDTWFANTKSAWSERFAKIGEDWDTWFANTKSAWTTWHTDASTTWSQWLEGVQSAWDTWNTNTQSAWDTWFATTKSAWSERFAKIGEDWDTWFTTTKTDYSEWLTSVQSAWTAYIEARTSEWSTFLIAKTEAFTTWWDALKSDVTTATSDANTAADAANTAAAAANTAATAANNATTSANEAATTASTAAQNADTATAGASNVNISSTGTEVTITDRNGNQTTIQTKGEKGDSVTMFPNVTIFGQPTIQESQISGFSTQNYLQFPFIVDFAGRPWQLDFSITTGTDLTQQHNVLDSAFGLALAISGGKFVLAMSTNGTSWDLGATLGSHTLTAASTYYLRLTFDGSRYVLAYSTDKQTYTTDITVQSAASLAPKQIIIGKSLDDRYVFNGSINMSDAHLAISGKVVWDGMDDAGLATRMAIDMSNIDAAGRERVINIVNEGPVGDILPCGFSVVNGRICVTYLKPVNNP